MILKGNKTMNINIKATNTTLTDSIRNTIEDKLQVLEKFLRPENQVFVELVEDNKHQSGKFFRAEVQISPTGHYAEAVANDFYEAMDLVLPKIMEQMRRDKDKKISLRRKVGNFFKRNR
jgi:putative sigma-54 modulation protein